MSDIYKEFRQAFTFIYDNNAWKYGSGLGSLAETTLEYRHFLESFIAKNDIKTIVDFGCGDWNFSRYIYWWNAEYTGYDTVEKIVETNNRNFSTDRIKFQISPNNFKEIKSTELLIVKDVLQHWTTSIILEFLVSIKSKFKYILITNSQYPSKDINKDIRIGQFRPVNLLTPPFNLQAELIFTYNFSCTLSDGEEQSDLKHTLLLKNW
jgi:SAM-dependent methyltransferase